jgi:hypothetical protein
MLTSKHAGHARAKPRKLSPAGIYRCVRIRQYGPTPGVWPSEPGLVRREEACSPIGRIAHPVPSSTNGNATSVFERMCRAVTARSRRY